MIHQGQGWVDLVGMLMKSVISINTAWMHRSQKIGFGVKCIINNEIQSPLNLGQGCGNGDYPRSVITPDVSTLFLDLTHHS